MSDQHPMFEAAVEVGQELAQRLKESKETKAVPFGKETATREQWRERLRTDAAFRKQQLEQLGQAELLARYRKSGAVRKP